jgi:hypothetical protein
MRSDYYHDIDLHANQLLNSRLHNISTAARTALGLTLNVASKGYQVYDTDLLTPYFWDGTQWVAAGGTLTGSGTVNYIPKWSSSSALTDSIIQQVSTNNIQIGSGSIAGTRLDLRSSDRVDFRMYPYSTTTDYFGIYSYGPTGYGSAYTQIGLNDGITSNQQGGALYLDTRGSLPPLSLMVKNNTTNVMTYALSVATSGNVGIGTTTPAYKLDVNGTGRFVNRLYADTDIYVNNYFAINTTATTFPIPDATLGIWRRKGNGFGTYFLEDEQGGAKDKWAFVKRQGYGDTREWYQTNSSIVNINYGWQSPNSSNYQGATLLIDPTINITNVLFTGTTVRGIYYNPTLTSIVNTTHIAYQNTSGDIIHGNLATGGAAQMVTADSNGKLGIQTIPTGNAGTVTSVGLSMPTAFTVTNSPVTTSGTIAVTGAGVVSQYIRGDGSLANFPTSTGGGSSVSYYLNGSVAQGTIGGIAYKQMSKTPVIGAGTDFTINADGYIQSFITDASDPALLNIPAGNWNFEMWFSASSGGGSPKFYVELYKWDGTTLSLIATSSATPEGITNGTAIDLYTTALAVPATVLLATDRLAVRVYVIHSSKTITLHTEDSHLCEIITTFSTGLTALNGLTAQVQNFANDTNVTMVSSGSTHTLTWAGTLADSRIASASTWNSKQNGRSVNVVSLDITAGNTAGTDYVYLVSGTTTITLPTAVGNTNRYSIKRSGTGVVSIATTSGQTIDGSSSPININVQYVSIDIISNGTDWEII